ncbi:MAG: ABC transporter permease [Treponema sp.]|jgi:NitT/TauT family transport system permease protein|nr:ABC transporter permease [Treponema sp.]
MSVWLVLKKGAAKAGFYSYRMLSVILFLVLWEIATRFKMVNPIFLPPFTDIIRTLWKLSMNGELAKHFTISAQRALTGFSLGVAIAVPLGMVIGWFRKFESFIDPLINIFRNLSVLALLPVFMLFFGIGEASKVALIFWGVLWTLLLNTIAGVKSVDPQLVKAARGMATPKWMLFMKVILPGAMPSIATGIRISATSSVLILMAAEMMGARKGLGFAIHFYEGQIRIPEMYAMIVVMAILGILISYALIFFEKHAFRWREQIGSGE